MNFAIFILSHKRADRVETYHTLRSSGYTGNVYIVIDDEDPQRLLYENRFGKDVIVFHKQQYIDTTDTISNNKQKSSSVYARNFIEQYAKRLNLDAFGMFDDDVLRLRYRWIDGDVIRSKSVTSGFDELIKYYTEYMLSTDLQTVSFGNVMTLISGVNGLDKRLAKERFTFQIHIRNTKYPLEWKSLINNDSISELQSAKLGNIWLSIPWIVYDSPAMNTLDGGMKAVYDAQSDFKRAFFATVAEPSCFYPKFSKDKFVLGRNNKSAYPMIVSGRYKK